MSQQQRLFSEYKPQLKEGMSVREYLTLEAEYWDHKLNRACNPWPLAPRDLVRLGLVNKRNFNVESFRLGAPSRDHMIVELDVAFTEVSASGAPEEVWVDTLGPGLWNRDMWWINHANKLGWNTASFDISHHSCELGAHFKASNLKPRRKVENFIIRANARDVTSEDGEMDAETDVIIYAAEFFQILGTDDKDIVMFNIGKKYRDRPRNLRMVLVHPFPEDNNKKAEWNGISLPGVEWGDTTPYTLAELLTPLEAGLNRRVNTSESSTRLEKTMYYHQTYSIFTLKPVV